MGKRQVLLAAGVGLLVGAVGWGVERAVQQRLVRLEREIERVQVGGLAQLKLRADGQGRGLTEVRQRLANLEGHPASERVAALETLEAVTRDVMARLASLEADDAAEQDGLVHYASEIASLRDRVAALEATPSRGDHLDGLVEREQQRELGGGADEPRAD